MNAKSREHAWVESSHAPNPSLAVTPDLALQAIGWPLDADGQPAVAAWREALAKHPAARPVRVVEQHRSGYVVADGPVNSFAVESPPEWQRTPGYKQGMTPTEQRAGVGDWVLIEPSTEHAAGKDQIVALLPRHSAIKRGAAGEHYKQQLIAANVDIVFVVCGLDADFNPRRIERYLLLVRSGGVEPVVVLTKADRAADDGAHPLADAIAALAGVASQEIAVVAVNAKDRASVAALEPWLHAGRTVALVGSSGAGKSTLTNTLLGTATQDTGAVRESDGRGMHTTTSRSLHRLPGGACVIDTPGVRTLRPDTDAATLAASFHDIEALSTRCRFRDCRHADEPGCAVRAGVDGDRLRNYQKLLREARRDTLGVLDRQRQAGVWKARGRATRAWMKVKRGDV